MVLTADLREQDAECAKYAANSANAAHSEGYFVQIRRWRCQFGGGDGGGQIVMVRCVPLTPFPHSNRARGANAGGSRNSLQQRKGKWVTFWKNILSLF